MSLFLCDVQYFKMFPLCLQQAVLCCIMSCIGATETVEGGDELPIGLCPLAVFCQSAWRRAGEMLGNWINREMLHRRIRKRFRVGKFVQLYS